MLNLTFKEIPATDEQQVRELIKHVLGGLKEKDFFIPYEEWEYRSFFDPSYGLIHGAYDKETLVGISQLYYSEAIISEAKNILGISEYGCGELGGNLVLPDYRGHGIMYTLGKLQIKLAKESGDRFVFALAHPDNIGSKKSLDKIGFTLQKTQATSSGYLRDFFIIDFQN